MSVRRLALTAAVLAMAGVLLGRLTPGFSAMAGALAHAQHTADTRGADVLVTSAAGLLAWAVWAWGAAGLALTALSALPGAAGAVARMLLHAVLPAGARRSAALFLGLGLAVSGPVAGATVVLVPAVAVAAVPGDDAGSPTSAVPDWPAATRASGPVPDWPAPAHTGSPPAAGSPLGATPGGAHVVLRGDCLWDIAATWLQDSTVREPADGDVASAAHAWWTANRAVIGADPDLLLPGQVLVPPGPP